MFILCLFGVTAPALRRLIIKRWTACLFTLLLLALNTLSFTPVPQLLINPAAVLLFLSAAVLFYKSREDAGMFQALASALSAAALMTLLNRLQISQKIMFSEPGFLLALCIAPFLLMLRESPRAALFCATLAPLLMAVIDAALDLQAFGYAVLEFGSPLGFDIQIAALALCGLTLMLRRKPKEAVKPDNGRVIN